MIPIPSAHKTAIQERPTVLEKKLIFTLVGGDVLTATNANIWHGSLEIDEAVSNSGSFEIGSTHINQMSVSLFGVSQSMISDAVFSINSEGHLMLNGNQVSYEDVYENINFSDATVEVWLASPGFEYFLRGTYTVVASTKNDSIINITAYDFMDKLSRDYLQSTRTYPCTLKQIVAEACTFCGVTDATGNFDHYNQTIQARPNTEALTFREVVGYVAQICGYNAHMSRNGQLQFVRYNLSGFDTEGAYNDVTEVYASSVDQNTITITGIHVDEENTVVTTDSEGIQTTSLVTTGYDAGTDGYVISIAGNPLIKGGLGQNVASWLYAAFGNKPFRIGSVTHSSDPCIEASDIMKVTDRHGTYNMLVSETRFSTGSAQTSTSSATSPRSTEAVQYTDVDKIKTVASEAHIVALAAQGYANQAQRSANAAQASADDAADAAQTAWEHADDANDAAQTAWNRAGDALTAANNAQTSATNAATAASNAQTSANNAQTSANNAQTQADLATGYAGDALIQLAEVEQVANILNWIAAHGSYSKTSDATIVQNKNYYTKSGDVYTLVTDPQQSDIDNYYELHIDEALSNYVSTHLALNNDGLYVIKDSNGYKLKLTNTSLQVIDANGNVVANYGTNITYDSTRPHTIGNNNNYIRFYDSDNDGIADSIAMIADQITIGSKNVGDAINGLENMEIGGRNLLRKEPTRYSQSAYLSYNIPTTIALTDLSVGDQLTIQLWDVSVDSNSSWVGVYWGGGSINISGFQLPNSNGYYEATYTVTAAHLARADAARKYVYIYNGVNGHSGTSLSIGKWKIERGNKATDWTPAPEDIDESIANNANEQDSLKKFLYGDTVYYYTTGGTTYEVRYNEADGQYHYTYESDGESYDAVVAYADLDKSGGEVITTTENGLQGQVEELVGAIDIDPVEPSITLRTTGSQGGTDNASLKISDSKLSFSRRGEEVAYIESTGDDDVSVLDIVNARVHNSLRIGKLEIFEHNDGIGIRRWD